MHTTSRISGIFGAALVAGALLLTACMNGEAVGGVDAWTGPPFSAEMFDLSHPEKPTSRIYLGDGNIRLESEDTASIGAIVLDPAHGTTLIVNAPAKSYIDAGMFTSLVTIGFAPLMRVLRPAGAGDPCTQWNSAINPFGPFVTQNKGAPPPHYACQSLGTESVNGRASHKWAVTSNDPNDGAMTIWVDDKLHVLSRSEDAHDKWEMRNIHEGALPDSLFTPPANYKKISMSSLLGGILNGGKDDGSGSSSGAFFKKLQGASSH